jgi:hypothetical protein
MAVPKFYRILRSQRGAAAKQKFLNHLEGIDTVSAIGTRGNRDDPKELFITPFNVKLGPTVVLKQSALTASFNKLHGAAGTHSPAALAANDTAVKLRGARAARVSASDGVSGTATVKTSKLTGLKYADYGGKSYSLPFGKSSFTATEVEADVFEIIHEALKTNFKRIHLIQEKI